MTTILIIILSAECLAVLIWGLQKRERLIQYPFLAAAVFAGWILPQVIGLNHQQTVSGDSLDKATLMAILCLAAIWIGYRWATPVQMLQWQFDRGRLILVSIGLCLIGAYFAYRVSLLSAEVTIATSGQWTGIITIYEFFSHLITVGMVVALLVHLRRPSWHTFAILLFGAAYYADRIIMKGRRAAMVEFAMIVLLGLWYRRRIAFPRWLVVLSLCAGALLVNSIGDYRGVMLGSDRTSWSGAGFSDIAGIDYLGNFMRAMTGERENFEVANAAMYIEATSRLSDYNLGLALWNGVVDKFVPGQWIGVDLKKSLKSDLDDAAYDVFRYTPHIGTTSTGMSGVFASFWYFGALEFALIGLFLGRWHKAAEGGNLVAQMVVILTMRAALESITHSTDEFVASVLVLCVFLLPALLFARVVLPGQRLAVAQAR